MKKKVRIAFIGAGKGFLNIIYLYWIKLARKNMR